MNTTREFTRWFPRRKPEKKALPAVPEGAVTLMEADPYQWKTEQFREQAAQAFGQMQHCTHLGLPNQAQRNAQVVIQLAFQDCLEGSGALATKVQIRPLSDVYKSSDLYFIGHSPDLWQMLEVDSQLVRLPQEALEALDRLLDFHLIFTQEKKVMQKVRPPIPYQDKRGGEKADYFSEPVMLPDPLLFVKVAGDWFCIAQWD